MGRRRVVDLSECCPRGCETQLKVEIWGQKYEKYGDKKYGRNMGTDGTYT
jgi:hypothetical protein